MKRLAKCVVVILAIVTVDQYTKLWVHNHMTLGPEGQINILGNFLKLTYVLNPSMAFSLQLSCTYGKLVITALRISASIYTFYYI